jgi:hypothetical protein
MDTNGREKQKKTTAAPKASGVKWTQMILETYRNRALTRDNKPLEALDRDRSASRPPVERPIRVNLRPFHSEEFRGCGSSFLFVPIRVNLRLRNVDELINRPLYPDALFGLRVSIPKGLLLADEDTVRAALRGHGANLRPGIT